MSVRTATFLLALPFLVPSALSAEEAKARGSDPGDPVFATSGIASTFSLPETSRDAKVPTPESVLGHRIGARYTTPEEILVYARAVAAASPRVKVVPYGKTPEGRELIQLQISTPENLARIEEIRRGVLALASEDGARRENAERIAEKSPVVVWIQCGVHGDEASGPEAALALLYVLAASNEAEVLRDLESTVLLLDPDVNADGRGRHVAWWRSVAGAEDADPDPDGLEHQKTFWPAGRVNHYGFDMNRDWAFLTQPETRARVAAARAFPPQVFVDVHEMGGESSYFFPPAASPVHKEVPESTGKWLETFGRANARAFDEQGWGYFVREVFDLYYPAYGDSWPTLRGAVGMTYEMAQSPGLSYQREDGHVLTLKERALKHTTALRATLATAAANRKALLLDFAAFTRSSIERGTRAFVLPAGQDRSRLHALATLLDEQGVRVEVTTKPISGFQGRKEPLPEGSLLVDSAQPLGRLASTLLEKSAGLSPAFLETERRNLLTEEQEAFYDVTAWSLPHAFALASFETTEKARFAGARAPWNRSRPLEAVPAARFGWLLPGDDSASRLAAGRLLAEGVKVSLTTKSARLAGRTLPAGSYLVRREPNEAGVRDVLTRILPFTGASPIPLDTAFTEEGPALGSSTVANLKKPKVVLVTGPGSDANVSGALRLSVERGLGIRVSRRTASSLSRGSFEGVTAVILPPGSSTFVREIESPGSAAALKRFVESGGVIVGIREGTDALRAEALGLSAAKVWEPEPDEAEAKKGGKPADADAKKEPAPAKEPAKPPAGKPAPKTATPGAEEDAELLADLARRPLPPPGAFVRTKGYPGHPILFGTEGADLVFLIQDGNPPKRLSRARANVLTVAATDPLAAGFAWKESLDRWAGAPLVTVEEKGKGRVVSFSADPSFRGFFRGPEILLLNSLLLAGVY